MDNYEIGVRLVIFMFILMVFGIGYTELKRMDLSLLDDEYYLQCEGDPSPKLFYSVVAFTINDTQCESPAWLWRRW